MEINMLPEKEILELIKKNLPEMTATQLEKFIKESNIIKSELESTKTKLKEVLEENVRLHSLELEKQKLEKSKLELDERQKAIEKRELELDKTILEIKLQNSNEQTATVFSLVDKVFGHPSTTITKNENSMKQIPYSSSDGNSWSSPGEETSSQTITKTESKS
jgi:hypothetical protein